MIAQNKGKDLEKIAKSKLVDRDYYYSTKYDGNYVQIKFDGALEVQMWSSGGKEFYLHSLAHYIISHFSDVPFHIECEYTYGCVGKLGDRVHSAKLTTYRTNHNKGIRTNGNAMKDNFYVLDMLNMPIHKFKTRAIFMKIFDSHDWFTLPKQTLVGNLKSAHKLMGQDVIDGFEGGMLKSPDHYYQPGKRSNDIIKLKPRLTADLLCTGIVMGEGKYEGMIGSLVLKDSEGKEVRVGAGLSDLDRDSDHSHFIGSVIEIGYEQILDTYIQPTYIAKRLDKSPEAID